MSDDDTRFDADGKKPYNMKVKTGFYGHHRFKLDPKEWSLWDRKAIKKWFNKLGYGDAIIKGESRSKKE